MSVDNSKIVEPIDGKWYITRELGRGAFGTVYEVERRDFGENMKSAMKIISIPSSANDVSSYREDNFDLDDNSVTSYFYGFVEEFVKEFQLMHKLRGHSNIVSYEDHTVKQRDNEIGWDIFIRMELLTPMGQYFAEHNISTEDVVKLGIDICKALEMCQKHQIIHRDIKPSNIFVSNSGDYKLGDFGVARTLEKTSSGLSKKGTYTYMAPEVFKGEEYGSSVDMYSLGIVMYRLLNNNMEPFREDRSHSGEETALLKRMRGDNIPKPANANDSLAEIVLKACSYKAEDRFKSVSVMREELERELECLRKDEENTEIFGEQDEISDKEKIEGEDKTVGIFSDINSEYDEKTVSLYNDVTGSTDDSNSDNELDEMLPENNFQENDDSRMTFIKKIFKDKRQTVILGVTSAVFLVLVWLVFTSSLRSKLVNFVPVSVEMEVGTECEFLTDVYSAGFLDGNIRRKIVIDRSQLNNMCVVEEREDKMIITALETGTAQIGVSVNGSDFSQVTVVIYDKIDRADLLQSFMDAESFLEKIKGDSSINQDNVALEKNALENIINSYGDIQKNINECSPMEIVEYKTLYQNEVVPAVEMLRNAYEIARNIKNDKTIHTKTPYAVSKCPVCGSKAHTTHPVPKCSICGSTAHTTHPVPKCPTCGSTSHTTHPNDLYIEPF